MTVVRVDYAGLGGVCHGLRALGIEPVGIEWMAAACRSRAASGLPTIRADLATYRQPPHVPLAGYWGSPPCQTFSTAGQGDGVAQLDDLVDVIHSERWADADRFDDRTRHVIDSARCAATLGAEWVGMEQVPAVLPLWRALAHVLERHGYSTWAGVLCAADYGVPQTRRRAILMASRTRCVHPPEPTHAEDPTPDLFGGELEPWVSMADALGWGFDFEPSATITTGGAATGGAEQFGNSGYRKRLREYVMRSGSTVAGGPLAERESGEPAFTVTSRADLWKLREAQANGASRSIDQPAMTLSASADNGNFRFERRLTIHDALALQGFPAGLSVHGTRAEQFTQVGNAVPPPLAAAIVAALTGPGAAA